MNVTFITHSNKFYGANRSLFNLIEGLQTYDVNLQVIAPYIFSPDANSMSNHLKEIGVPVYNIPLSWWVSPSTNGHFLKKRRDAFYHLLSNFRHLPKLIKVVRAWQTDIIYTNSSVLPMGAWASYFTGLPHVWHLRELNDLHYEAYFDWGKWIMLTLISQAAVNIYISETVQSYYQRSGRAKQYVIYNGVASIGQFDSLRQQALHTLADKKVYTFAIIGVIHPSKGQEEAIRAMALLVRRYPNTRLLIVGAGDTDFLKGLISELSLDEKVELWGHIDEPYKAFFAADAILMCSRHEAMGRVTVEAMAASRPVIGYADGGTVELIEDGKNGLLYRGGPEELAHKMCYLVGNSEKGRQMGAYGWTLAREKYSIERYAEEVYEVLSSLMSPPVSRTNY